MSAKLKEFAARARLCAVGNSKGFIFRNALLAEAGVESGELFRILVTDRKIIFVYPKPAKANTVVPRPLSFYLKQRLRNSQPTVSNEVWPDDGPRGKERLA